MPHLHLLSWPLIALGLLSLALGLTWTCPRCYADKLRAKFARWRDEGLIDGEICDLLCQDAERLHAVQRAQGIRDCRPAPEDAPPIVASP